MPDPNTEAEDDIVCPDIHIHIESIFHCTICDEVFVGCYTCHEKSCWMPDDYDDE